ncbi:MAG: CPBP family intramembrane metalloprotease [Acidobacteria bacterium]|nr:MAG: CPBP family intramembrane metalloprotease [Acidobacteriota bacterium]
MPLLSKPLLEFYRQELRMFLRDRRAVVLSIVLPVLVMPLLIFGSHWVHERRARELETATHRYVVTGSEAALVRSIIDGAVKQGWNTDSDKPDEKARFVLEEIQVSDPSKSLSEEKLDFYLEAQPAPPPQKVGKTSADRDPESGQKGVLTGRGQAPVIRVHFRGDRDSSRKGASRIRDLLLKSRTETRYALLHERGFAFEPQELARAESQDLATKDQASGLYVGRFLTLFLILFVMIGGSAVAIDSIAGEKERGTLETLLTTSIRRADIIGAKMLLVLTVSFVITGLQVINVLIYMGLDLIKLPEGMTVSMSPGRALLLLVLYLPVIFLASGSLLLISGLAKTYKEAQLYFTPVFFLFLLPAIAPLFPGLKLRSAMVLLPVSNISLGVKEVLVGRADWPMLLLAWLVTAAAGVYVARRVANTLSTEKLITASETDLADLQGGPALFPRHVLKWFALVWVIMLLVATNVESLQSIWSQVLFNIVFLFGGASFFMIRRYQLPVRQALALRPVHPAVWPAVLLGAPASLVLAHAVFRLANLFFPVPQKMMESFSQMVIPPEYALWQVFLLVAVIPGIGEELAFRGVLLYGLRKRYHPVVLALVVGAIFGFFHVALFRLVPTAFLGVILTAVTLLTGSIFPAMLWHALNNATSIVLSRYNASPTDLGMLQMGASVLLLGVALLVIWLFRTPYPGLKQGRRNKDEG